MLKIAFARRATLTMGLTVLAVLLCLPTAAVAGDPPGTVPDGGFGPNNRPVYFVVSLADEFDTPYISKGQTDENSLTNVTSATTGEYEMGSQLMIIPVGQYIAGNEIGDSRYEGADLSSIDLTDLPIDPHTGLPMDPELLDGNPATVLGSFCTFQGEIHVVSPDPAPIPAAVQEAFFRASAIFDQIESQYPTTVELACFIYENQGDAGADVNEIMAAITATPMTLSCTTCYTEGDLFPHDPEDGALFSFSVRFDPVTGDFELNVCLPVTVWVKGEGGTNPINLGSKGVTPVVVPSTAFFDAVAELDVDTMQIGTFVTDSAGIQVFVGVPIVKSSTTDENGDGKVDVKLHFDTKAIAALDGVDENTTELRFRGLTNSGMCVEGVDMISVVPPKKNKNK